MTVLLINCTGIKEKYTAKQQIRPVFFVGVVLKAKVQGVRLACQENLRSVIYSTPGIYKSEALYMYHVQGKNLINKWMNKDTTGSRYFTLFAFILKQMPDQYHACCGRV